MLAVVGDRSAMRGVLRLGVAETIVHTWLPQLIKSVNQTYPNLSLEIDPHITSMTLTSADVVVRNLRQLHQRHSIAQRQTSLVPEPFHFSCDSSTTSSLQHKFFYYPIPRQQVMVLR
jgi:DNA-binding transcriptional LysR family regulator